MIAYFNSIKVRLEPFDAIIEKLRKMDFNSIKVRLERIASLRPLLARCTFQFHKGTIRTGYRCLPPSPVLYFNSIKVRLEPEKAFAAWLQEHDFNSIKVRLERPKERCPRALSLISIP